MTYLFIGLLIFVELALFATNYTHGTYLIGWDNVMPEFNQSLNFIRTITSLWQEYRGLGTLDGLAHTANVLHSAYLFILSLFLPDSALRYVFIHLTHLLGGIGFYILSRYLTKSSFASFTASLFYMLNLGVIQMYFAPLEVFAVHFAALPFITLTLLHALESPSKKNLLWLFLTFLLATPQGFVPTIFIVLSILLGSLMLFDLFTHKDWKKVVLIGATIFAANAFWMLPYAYSALKTPAVIKDTRINQFSSDEIFYRNYARGDMLSVLTMKGFMVDTIEYDTKKNTNAFFMDMWRSFSSSIFYHVFFFLVLCISLYGIAKSITKKEKGALPILVTFGICFLFLANSTPVLEQINLLVRGTLPLVGEAFRFPFTKFITVFAFCLALFLALGLASFKKFGVLGEKPLSIIIALCILGLSTPAFLGNFTSPLLRLEVPEDYFQTFDYFNTQPSAARIAMLPVHAFWNWEYRDWGHRGSGFMWHGIKQPILVRAFDPWSQYNEQFYNEIAYSIHSENKIVFEKTLKKYDVSFLVLDEHIFNTLSNQPIQYDRLKRFLNASTSIAKEQEYGKITIYKVSPQPSRVYSLGADTIKTSNTYTYEKQDSLALQNENYITSTDTPDTALLFPSLFTEKLQENLQFTPSTDTTSITLTATLRQPIAGKVLHIPSLFERDLLISVEAKKVDGTIHITPIYPKLFINNQEIEIPTEPIILRPQVVTNPDTIQFVDIKHKVNFSNQNTQSYILNNYLNSFKVGNSVAEEILFFDTSLLTKSSYTIPLTGTITSAKIVLPKIESPLAVKDIIKDNKYEISRRNDSIHPFLDKAFSDTKLSNNALTLMARSDTTEMVFYKDNLYHQGSYLLLAKTAYTEGLPMNFYVDNSYQNRPEVEVKFSKNITQSAIIIPPSEDAFSGYGFHFYVKSVGRETASSTLSNIELYPIPYYLLKNIQVNTQSKTLPAAMPKVAQPAQQIAPFLYTVSSPEKSSYITLSQGYAEGWKAYRIKSGKWKVENWVKIIFPFIFGEKLDEHVKVNNWANGWVVHDTNSQLVIIYLPQYLQYLGFGIFGGFLLWLIFGYKKDTTKKDEVRDEEAEYFEKHEIPEQTIYSDENKKGDIEYK